MSRSELVSATQAHIEALLDDPMTMLIMAVDKIDREDAKQLFNKVASRLATSALPRAESSEEKPEAGMFFQRQNRRSPEYGVAI